jgi:hypothetical protein
MLQKCINSKILTSNKMKLLKMNKDIISVAAEIWSEAKEAGIVYERRIRKSWKKRLKRETQ